MTDFKKLLGNRIRELRKQKGYSQEYLAELVGIGISNISNIETGKSSPAPENLFKIAKALSVTPNDIYMFEHYNDKEYLLSELSKELSKDEKLLRLVYKFYLTVKN